MADTTHTPRTLSRYRVHRLTATAILAAVSSVLMFFSFNVPLMPSFITLDFSELPALLASYTIGPISGVVVCLIKNLVNLMFSKTGGVGELSNFLLGATFTLVAGALYHHSGKPKTRPYAVLWGVCGAVAMGGISMLTNYFITYPVYMKLFMPREVILGMYQTFLPWVDNLWAALAIFNLPFTCIKGLLSVLICFLIYKPLTPILGGSREPKVR